MLTKHLRSKLVLTFLLVTLILLVQLGVVQAAIPNNSVIIGEMGFSVEYLMDPANFAVIMDAVIANGLNPMFYHLEGQTSVFTEIMSNQPATPAQLAALPAITYYNADGTISHYAAGNGNLMLPASAIADVNVGALGFKDITIKSVDGVEGAAKFKVDCSTMKNELGTSIRILNMDRTVEISILAVDGSTVLATGTLDISKTAVDLNFALTVVAESVTPQKTAAVNVQTGAMNFREVNVSSCPGVIGAAKFQISGYTGVESIGTPIRFMTTDNSVELLIMGEDGETVLARGTINLPVSGTSDMTVVLY